MHPLDQLESLLTDLRQTQSTEQSLKQDAQTRNVHPETRCAFIWDWNSVNPKRCYQCGESEESHL